MSSNLTVRCIKVGLLDTNCYIVSDRTDSSGPFLAVIDPGDDFQLIGAALEGAPTHIILTHCHFDHVGALNSLHEAFPEAKIAAGENEQMNPELYVPDSFSFPDVRLPKPAILLKEGDTVGPFTVLHTPGHTMGSICLYSRENRILFSGDTLFRHSYGRTDLGGSDADMAKSLRRLLHLEADTTVYPGHDGITTIVDERAYFGMY